MLNFIFIYEMLKNMKEEIATMLALFPNGYGLVWLCCFFDKSNGI